MISLGVVVPFFYTRTISRESEVSTARILSGTVRSLDLVIRSIGDAADMVMRDGETSAFLRDADAGPSRDKRFAIIDSLCALHPEITGILVADARKDRLAGDFRRLSRDALREEAWFLEAASKPGKLCVLTRPVGRNIRNLRHSDATQVATFVKAISGPGGEIIGAVMIDVDLSYFDGIFSGAAPATDGFILVLDARDGVVYAPANPVTYRIRPESLGVSGKGVDANISGERFRILYEESLFTGWKVIGVFSMKKLLREIDFLITIGLGVSLIALCIAVSVSFAFAARIARPVTKLTGLMKCVESGDLSVRYSGSSSWEIAALGNGFNTMVAEIGNLIDLVYREQKSKREAEFKVLQAQIKPHFLYNTLDTIQWMAKEKGANDIVHMVSALTSLFRIGLSKGRETIAVADEIEHVKSYLVIQKMRYGDKFDFFFDVEDAVLGLRTIKLILQPVVENAIYHGVKEKRGHGTILLCAKLVEGQIEYEISDDGAGMSAEKAAEISRGLEGPEPPGATGSAGYGLYNINQRIRLTCPDARGVVIESREGEGTVVRISHPPIEALSQRGFGEV